MSGRSRIRQWIKRLAMAAALLSAVGVGVAVGSYAYFSRDLPSVDELRTWRPPQVTKVTCRNDKVCAEFFTERRTWVDVRELPKHVRDSFLAAEDADFYQHGGLDFIGIARSALKNLKPGGMKSGASTISQQTCRRLLLSQERSIARKIREWILTPRMEEALSKDEILNLYVNTIWFGHQRYGVEEAALFYFGKHARELGVGEAAVLAGTVQLPHRINPVTNIVKAKRRQRYVLNQLADKGFVERSIVEKELEAPIQLGPRPPATVGLYYAEWVRMALVARYGEKTVMQGGMRVTIAMDPALQAAAETSVRAGLEAVDRRRGYRGPVGHVEPERFAQLRPLLEARLAEAGKRKPDDVLVADLTALRDLVAPVEEERAADAVEEPVDPDEPIASPDELLARSVGVKTLTENLETVGWVSTVNDSGGDATVELLGRTARLELASSTWARRRTDDVVGPTPTKISDVVQVGDLVRVRIGALGPIGPVPPQLPAKLAQVPQAQGALLAIDPTTRSVVAMVGGYDFATSSFNRATQAHRQPGSSFKPFIYGAALASGRYTATSIFNDAPFAVRDPGSNTTWKPRNFDGRFDGPMTMREALTKSKNTVSVRLIEAVGVDAGVEFAEHAGVKSPLPANLTLALGTGEVTMLELANAYTTLQTNGQYADPLVLLKVSDATGKLLEEHRAAPQEALAPTAAFLTTSLMRSVVEEGTATAVLELGRPAAGKTGTAQEYRDAWFTGFTADLVASAWVGFDDHRPIGPNETGGRAALPLWLEFMKAAHRGVAVRDFTMPPGVVAVRIDPRTGKLAGKAVPGRLEYFLAGTEPTEETADPNAMDPNEFILKGGNRR